MVLDRLKQVAQHVTGTAAPPHPFDPLSRTEIESAVAIIRKEHGSLFYNAVTLWEPRKADMLRWLADPDHTPRPSRVADVVAIAKEGKVYDGLVDLKEQKIVKWESIEGVQPLVFILPLFQCKGLLWLTIADHHGRPSDRRIHCEERSQGYRAMSDHWHT